MLSVDLMKKIEEFVIISRIANQSTSSTFCESVSEMFCMYLSEELNDRKESEIGISAKFLSDMFDRFKKHKDVCNKFEQSSPDVMVCNKLYEILVYLATESKADMMQNMLYMHKGISSMNLTDSYR